MNAVGGEWRVPKGGGCLIGPLGPDGPLVVEVALPDRAERIDLRGIGDAVCLVPAIGGVEVSGQTVLPVPGGFWMRLTLAWPAGTENLRLTLARDSGLRFLLVSAYASRVAPGFFPLSGLPDIHPRGTDGEESVQAGQLADLLRRGSVDAALAALRRVPHARNRALVSELLGMLADDPGDAPGGLLPFLALCSKGLP